MTPTGAVFIGLCAAIGVAAGASVSRMRPVVVPINEAWYVDRTHKGDMLPLPPQMPFPMFDDARMFPPAPIDPWPVVGPPKPAPPRDPVCGAKGRTWYRNGLYWRCNR